MEWSNIQLIIWQDLLLGNIFLVYSKSVSSPLYMFQAPYIKFPNMLIEHLEIAFSLNILFCLILCILVDHNTGKI